MRHYLIRLTDGRRVACRREQLALRRAFQQERVNDWQYPVRARSAREALA